jgi:hypothetical protein
MPADRNKGTREGVHCYAVCQRTRRPGSGYACDNKGMVGYGVLNADRACTWQGMADAQLLKL